MDKWIDHAGPQWCTNHCFCMDPYKLIGIYIQKSGYGCHEDSQSGVTLEYLIMLIDN